MLWALVRRTGCYGDELLVCESWRFSVDFAVSSHSRLHSARDNDVTRLRRLLMPQIIRQARGHNERRTWLGPGREDGSTHKEGRRKNRFIFFLKQPLSSPNLAFVSSSRRPSAEVNTVSHINAGVHSKAQQDHICSPAADSCPQISGPDYREQASGPAIAIKHLE